MKNTFTRILTLLVALAMVLCCFTACSKAGDNEEAVLDEEISGTNTVTDQDVDNDTPEIVDDEDTEVVEPDDSEPSDNDQDDEKEPADDNSSDEDDQKGDEDSKGDESKDDEEDKDYSDLFDEVEKDYSNHFIVASYNVQSFQGGKKEEYEGIAKEIKELGPIVVGLQELQNLTKGNDEQVKVIAEMAGYDYYQFTRAIDHNGGQYGTGVISKYPIKSHEVFHYENQYAEERSFSRSVIDIDGKIMNFYNTHLCLGGNAWASKQLNEVLTVIKKNGDKNVVITGDMNAQPEAFINIIDTKELIPLNGGDTFYSLRNTFPAGDSPSTPIDNIIVSQDWDYYLEEDTQVGILVSKTDWSDHNMCYTYLKFKD